MYFGLQNVYANLSSRAVGIEDGDDNVHRGISFPEPFANLDTCKDNKARPPGELLRSR